MKKEKTDLPDEKKRKASKDKFLEIIEELKQKEAFSVFNKKGEKILTLKLNGEIESKTTEFPFGINNSLHTFLDLLVHHYNETHDK